VSDHWADSPDFTYCIRAEFADGSVAYTTLEHAADLAGFIDRDKGIADMLKAIPFRTSLGTILTAVTTDD